MEVTAHEFNREFTNLNQQERGIVRETIEMIAYCMKRRFYAELGYSSVQGWLMKEHGYAKSCAYRRIEAAKLVTSVPEAIEKLEAGKVNLSTLATLQTAIRQEEKRTAHEVSTDRREELLTMIEDKTEEQAERIIAVEFPEIIRDKTEYVKPLSATETRMNLVFNEEQMAILERVKEVASHSHFNASWSELFVAAAKEFLKHHDPVQKAERSIKRAEAKLAKSSVPELSRESVEQSSAPKPSKAITPKLRAFVIRRDAGRCRYVSASTGVRCDCREGLEVDHIVPRARGGSNAPENLRTLCREHNQLEAIVRFGRRKMDSFIRSPSARYVASA